MQQTRKTQGQHAEAKQQCIIFLQTLVNWTYFRMKSKWCNTFAGFRLTLHNTVSTTIYGRKLLGGRIFSLLYEEVQSVHLNQPLRKRWRWKGIYKLQLEMSFLTRLVFTNVQTCTFSQITHSLHKQLDKCTCTHLLLAPVVGGQVCGALCVVSPSAVDTEHLLPVSRCITLAVGSPWATGVQDIVRDSRTLKQQSVIQKTCLNFHERR